MNKLPNELIIHISSFLDSFHKIQFANVSKNNYILIYNEQIQYYVRQYLHNIQFIKQQTLNFIKRINTDGVIYGECEQCFCKGLLYTRFDGYIEQCICLNNCNMYCHHCLTNVSFHSINRRCPICRNYFIQHPFFIQHPYLIHI